MLGRHQKDILACDYDNDFHRNWLRPQHQRELTAAQTSVPLPAHRQKCMLKQFSQPTDQTVTEEHSRCVHLAQREQAEKESETLTQLDRMVTGLKFKDGVVQGSSCGRETRPSKANRPQKQQKRTVDLQTGLGNHSHTLIPRPATAGLSADGRQLGHRVTAEAASHKKNFNALIPIKVNCARHYTLYGSVRPFVISALIADFSSNGEASPVVPTAPLPVDNSNDSNLEVEHQLFRSPDLHNGGSDLEEPHSNKGYSRQNPPHPGFDIVLQPINQKAPHNISSAIDETNILFTRRWDHMATANPDLDFHDVPPNLGLSHHGKFRQFQKLPEKLARMAASTFLSDAAIRFKLGRAPPSELLTHSNSAAQALGHRV
ncbi:hypothetical protein PCASD_08430 [Puccinia coronata f. sp. avenae]|uniref:Uncharacterized protein n=1 Tax=Puccinia coronata f. sp. avenae TaxID=200324 RepID=A0A2N5UN08_9BASI|nr:hypothetical protein PCASD_08430 [Puccinia coronata f. sp. avenae]